MEEEIMLGQLIPLELIFFHCDAGHFHVMLGNRSDIPNGPFEVTPVFTNPDTGEVFRQFAEITYSSN